MDVETYQPPARGIADRARRATLRLLVILGGAVAFFGLAASRVEASEVVRPCFLVFCQQDLVYTASPGESNHIDTGITDARWLWIRDDGSEIALGETDFPFGNGCRYPAVDERQPFFPPVDPPHIVVCPWGTDGRVSFWLGDSNDWISSGAPGVIRGGAGDDVLRTRAAARIEGEEGDDELLGSADDDVLSGGPGNDHLDGGYERGNSVALDESGADILSGGPDFDIADYRYHRELVAVSIDDLANDGNTADGTGDNVRSDIEEVIGTAFGHDTLVGSERGDTLIGLGGDDTLRGGGGDDVLYGGGMSQDQEGPYFWGGRNLLDGGDGNDQLTGGFGDDTLLGGPGDDQLVGDDVHTSEGTDQLLGGAGNDLLDAGRSAFKRDGTPSHDDVFGGEGIDRVSYESRIAGVSISLDERSNDGEPGEMDNVRGDVEVILGGAGDDRLSGNAAANTLIGNGGDDVLDGAGGPDEIFGGAGFDFADYRDRKDALFVALDDTTNDGGVGEDDNVHADVEGVYGGWGPDKLFGNARANTLYGGPGSDSIVGLAGPDVLSGDEGNDTLDAADGTVDKVLGGAGSDRARVDKFDAASSVESVF